MAIINSTRCLGVVLAVALGSSFAPADAAILTGRVLADGRPLAGATLEVLDARSDSAKPFRTAETDRDGRFRITTPVGFWTLSAGAAGRATQRFDLDPSETAAERLELPTVDLRRSRRLLVAVRDAADRPTRARVGGPVAGSADPTPGHWRPTLTTVSTDVDGRARIDAVPGTRLRIVTTEDGRALAPRDVEVPATGALEVRLDSASARRVVVRRADAEQRPAAEARIVDPVTGGVLATLDADGQAKVIAGDLGSVRILGANGERGVGRLDAAPSEPASWTVEPARPVRGEVVSAATGEPLGGSLVWARALDGTPTLAMTGEDGRFALRVAATTPRLGALAPAHDLAEAVARGGRVRLDPSPHRLGFGLVVDSDERPIEGALVTLAGRAGHTDADGRFALANPEPGRHDLLIEAEGARRTRIAGLEIPSRRGEVDLGVVTLVDGDTLGGWVVDAGGRALDGAEIVAVAPSDAPTSGEPLARATSDGSGAFRLDGLAPGPVTLQARAEGHESARRTVDVPLDDGVEIVLAAAVRLAGRVVDARGVPVPDALVSVEALAGEPSAVGHSATTDADGRFDLDGPSAGPVRVVATAAEHAPARLRVDEVAYAGELEIVLPAGVSLVGTARDAEGRPLAARLTVMPPSSDGGAADGAADGVAVAGPDGRFRFAGLAPGERRLIAVAADGRRIERELRLEAGEQVVDVTFDAAAVEVYGQVVDAAGQGVAGARVVLHEIRGGAAPETETDAYGDFRFASVAPGDYSVHAEQDGLAPSREAELLAVGESDVGGVTVVLGRGASVHGRVAGVGLDELDRVVVRALGVPGGVGVDWDGRFVLGPLPEGELILEAVLRGTGRITRERIVVPSEGRAPDIEMLLR